MTTDLAIIAALSTLLIAGLLIYLRYEFAWLSRDINQVDWRMQKKILKYKQSGWFYWFNRNDDAMPHLMNRAYSYAANKLGIKRPSKFQPKRRKYRDNK